MCKYARVRSSKQYNRSGSVSSCDFRTGRAKMVDAQYPKSYVYAEPDLKAHL